MQYVDVVVTLRLAEAGTSADGTRRVFSAAERQAPARTYDALIYTDLPAFRRFEKIEPPPGTPARLGRYPLASVESLRLHWDRYQTYLAQFLEVRKSDVDIARRLFDAMSPGLERLFSGAVDFGQPIRVWWSPESVELEDFPWELVAYMDKDPQEIERFSFVRGLPPDTPPSMVPLEGNAPLRLALMPESATDPTRLQNALAGIPGLEVIRLSGSPRDMLQQVAHSNFELLHIICDGIASLAYDGILYFHGASSPELAAQELASSLRPTRTVCLAFSSTYVLNPDLVQISGRDVPSAYRAFAYLASADLPLPTIMAPLAPADFAAAMQFWRAFYSRLAATLSIEQGAANARKEAPLAVALYMRHPCEQQFRRRSAVESALPGAVDAPSELGAELEVSERLVQRLQKITAHSSRTLTGVHEFLQKEKVHQERLSSQLAPWRESDKL
jgi:hypothetical protein